MPKAGRNQPCSCGSGVKAKRCCGVSRGPSDDQLAAAYLRSQAREWAPVLVDYTDAELDDLLDEVVHLPERSLTLQLALPRLLPPALERLRGAVADDDEGAMAAAMPDALGAVDRPSLRARLARAVIDLHDDDHQTDCDVTAYAVIDLAENERSMLFGAALIHSLAVAVGSARTPSGLLVGSV